ncbi:dihydrofolate reductase family protein [Pseudomonas entomophila]|uniref:dihydrofolate reductase family protein n=1 Tax=Pseudomonas entomophila TaxID=312306 RepID=UPI0023D7D792|nr:dihydrofolate reductase family protein [Pseudomonas entomophila]MDF0732073.1 dihydrofolate reductase family protein [Pseudomonas entomophila]
MTTAHVFIATSLDGFIARPDGHLDWLPMRPAEGEDFGYDTFIADIDLLVMGRGTFDKVVGFDPWPYHVPVLVLSRQLAGTAVPERLHGKVRFAETPPAQLMRELEQQGVRRVYVDGGQLVQSFLREGLVSDLVITTVPVLIGAGRPLFGALARDVALELVASRALPASGMVQSTYRVRG